MDSRKDCVFIVSDERVTLLSTLITKPIKLHVCSFVSVLYNCVSDGTFGENVFKFNWCWTLDVSNFM